MPPHIDNIAQSNQQTGARATPGDPRMNAFKHGLYAEAALLPGEDVAAFERHRLGLFRLYRPQTQEEAKVIDEIAECQWIRQRLRPMQAQADQQAIAPDSDAAGRICEPAAHKRIHTTMDVSVRRSRIDIAERRAFGKLMLQQKLRRQGLIAGARKLPADCYMDAAGIVRGPVPVPDLTPMPEEGCQGPAKLESTGSGDGRNGKNWEQKEMVGEVGFGPGRSTTPHPHPLPPLLPRAVYGEGAGDGVLFAGARATATAGHIGREPGASVLSGTVLLGQPLQSTRCKPSAPAQPTGPGPGYAVLPPEWAGYSMVSSA